MKRLDDGRIQCRVKISGVYNGKSFTYTDKEDSDGSQFYWPEDRGNWEASEYWWSEGNMACDCNRGKFIGKELDCGDTVLIDSIAPVDCGLPPLLLNESGEECGALGPEVMMDSDEGAAAHGWNTRAMHGVAVHGWQPLQGQARPVNPPRKK